MAYQVKNIFTCRMAGADDITAQINEIAEAENCANPMDILRVLVGAYLGEEKPAKSKKPELAPSTTQGLFVAEIDPLDADKVNNMRKVLYQRHKYRDSSILAHWAEVFNDIEENRLFMVRPPKNTRDLIVEQGQSEIDEGTVRDFGQFISKKLQEIIKKKEKKGGWFD